MKIILVAVSTLDGKITKGDNPHIHSWTSKEDQQLFSYLIEKNNLIVMGRKTYEAVKKTIKLSEGKLRIVLTKSPQDYIQNMVRGQLEFSSESPRQLVKRLEEKGYKQMLLVGGSEINGLFFESTLVDEFYLTVEPCIFGEGIALVNGQVDIRLKLISYKKLNPQGSLFLQYKVQKHSF